MQSYFLAYSRLQKRKPLIAQDSQQKGPQFLPPWYPIVGKGSEKQKNCPSDKESTVVRLNPHYNGKKVTTTTKV